MRRKGRDGALGVGDLPRSTASMIPHYAGFCRVIWTAHVREMTDLAPGERHCT
jgi:hypothetical protein